MHNCIKIYNKKIFSASTVSVSIEQLFSIYLNTLHSYRMQCVNVNVNSDNYLFFSEIQQDF